MRSRLAVVLILAVFGLLALPVLRTYARARAVSAARPFVERVDCAQRQHYADFGRFSDSLDRLTAIERCDVQPALAGLFRIELITHEHGFATRLMPKNALVAFVLGGAAFNFGLRHFPQFFDSGVKEA